MVLKNEILVEYASSKEMVADLLTKAATAESFKGHVHTMGVKSYRVKKPTATQTLFRSYLSI